MRNQLSFLILLALFASCSDEGSVSAKDKSSNSNYAAEADYSESTYVELPVCNDRRGGKIAYVVDISKFYVCEDGEWVVSSTPKKKNNESSYEYKTVAVGNQIWMARNLNIETDESYCLDNVPSNCDKYGRLYTWESALNACPDGWHLPSKEEFEILQKNVSAEFFQSIGIEDTSMIFGFSPLLAGAFDSYDGGFYHYSAFFWSSSEKSLSHGYFWEISDDYGALPRVDDTDKGLGFSVRCLKDSDVSDVKPSSYYQGGVLIGSVEDNRDGQTYSVVKIENSFWMNQNLNFEMEGSRCYEDDPSYCDKYGRLYTWGAASKACPAGWRLPSVDDYSTLMENDAMRDCLNSYFVNDEIFYYYEAECVSNNLRANSWDDGADLIGFSALPGGYYLDDGFYSIGHGAEWWSSMEYDEVYAEENIGISSGIEMVGHFTMLVGSEEYSFYVGIFYENDISALSVRCVQNSN